MGKFKVGDRVEIKNDNYINPRTVSVGSKGTILELSEIPYIQFDQQSIDLHDAGGMGIMGYCWAVHECDLELIDKPVEIIEAPVKKNRFVKG